MLSVIWIEVKGCRISHVSTRFVGNHCDIIAYLVLLRVAFEGIKRIAYSDVRRPGSAGVGAEGIKQLRVGVISGISRVIPDSIKATIGRH